MTPEILVGLYNLVNIILFPLYLVFFTYRVIIKKGTILSIKERLGLASKARQKGKLVWLHAASIGESIVALTLVQAIYREYPKVNFLVTTGTISSANILAKALPKNAAHQFVPIDNSIIVKRFLHHWQPDLGIFIESELWPCLIHEASKKCPLMLVNGRLSDKSFDAWMKRKKLFNYVAGHFSKVLLQSDKDLSKYIALGYLGAVNLGNIKFSNMKLEVNAENLKELREVISDKKIFVAASTHREDEEVVLKMIQNLKKEAIDYYPIVILRHPKRREEIANQCSKMNLTFSLRSISGRPNMEDDLYIVDTFKELGLFYTIATITFVGGSFRQGGHNLMEPAYFNNTIILGPDMSNFQNIADEMIGKEAALQIRDEAELEQQVKLLLGDGSAHERQKMSQNAREYVESHKDVLKNYMSEIKNFIL